MMHCEICGRTIDDKVFMINIEGARMQVCERCAKYGRESSKADAARSTTKPPQQSRSQTTLAPPRIVAPSPRSRDQLPRAENLEAIENLGEIIRNERQKRGMSQEEFGKLVLERASLINKIETGRHVPPISTLKKLERHLNIKLVMPRTKFDANFGVQDTDESIRLGDIVKIKKKE